MAARTIKEGYQKAERHINLPGHYRFRVHWACLTKIGCCSNGGTSFRSKSWDRCEAPRLPCTITFTIQRDFLSALFLAVTITDQGAKLNSELEWSPTTNSVPRNTNTTRVTTEPTFYEVSSVMTRFRRHDSSCVAFNCLLVKFQKQKT
jgi:hypothetical protein